MCTTNGGNPDTRPSCIDPLTGTAPEVGSASATRPRQPALVVRRAGLQHPIRIRQLLTVSEEATGAVIRRQDPPAPVQVDDADPRVVEQGRHGRVPSLGADQRLPDADELSDVGREPPDHRDLRRPPAFRGDGIPRATRSWGSPPARPGARFKPC